MLVEVYSPLIDELAFGLRAFCRYPKQTTLKGKIENGEFIAGTVKISDYHFFKDRILKAEEVKKLLSGGKLDIPPETDCKIFGTKTGENFEFLIRDISTLIKAQTYLFAEAPEETFETLQFLTEKGSYKVLWINSKKTNLYKLLKELNFQKAKEIAKIYKTKKEFMVVVKPSLDIAISEEAKKLYEELKKEYEKCSEISFQFGKSEIKNILHRLLKIDYTFWLSV